LLTNEFLTKDIVVLVR